jgi:hypothetical protein
MQRSLITDDHMAVEDGQSDNGLRTTLVDFESSEKTDKDFEEERRNQSNIDSNAVSLL